MLIDDYELTRQIEQMKDVNRDDVIALIGRQKPVDAVPVRHGMFIGTEYDGYADGNPVYYEWKCSECGCIFEEDEPTYKYCPNCGAKMDEV